MRADMALLPFILTTVLAIPAEGQVAWEPFTIEDFAGRTVEATIGSIEVPENPDTEGGHRLALTFVRLPATTDTPAAPIVYLAGGPGGSGIGAARLPSMLRLIESLTAVADVILLDQRGTGRSGADRLRCKRPELPPLDLLASMAKVETWRLAGAERCRRELAERGVDLGGYQARASADDLDALRRALGVPRIGLLGFSYGTHLGLAAIRRHGAVIERAALVGVEGPDHTRKLPLSIDTQIRKLARMAARDPAIATEVPDMAALLDRVLARLAAEPLPTPVALPDGTVVEVPIGPAALQAILMADVGDGNDFPVFPALLHTIDQRDPSMLAWFLRKRIGRFVGGTPALYVAVDGASGASPERWTRIEREAGQALLGRVPTGLFPDLAEAMRIPDLGAGFRAPIVSDVETLFVSGTLDANAPPYQAEEVRWGFTRAHHLVVRHAGHEDMLGHPEVDAVIVDFFRGEDVSARTVSLPVPRFLSLTAAKADRRIE